MKKTKKIVALCLTCIMVVGVASGCSINVELGNVPKDNAEKVETKNEETKKPEKPAEEKEESTKKPASNGDFNADKVVKTSVENPANLGEWIEATRYSATDQKYHTVYYRVNKIMRGKDAQSIVDRYNAEDHVVVFEDLADDDMIEYCALEYDVYFPEDFPDSKYGIASCDLTFNVTGPNDDTIKDKNGRAYIGLSSVYDATEDSASEKIHAGDIFHGQAIYGMGKSIDNYLLKVDCIQGTISDSDKFVTYVKPN